MNHQWTKEEEDMLRVYYKQDDKTARMIGGMFGITRAAVKCKANRMGLSNISTRRPWTKEDDKKLEFLVGRYTTSTIAGKLRRSVCAVVRRAERLALSRRVREGWFTQDAVCRILGVDHRWLQYRIKNGEIKATKQGGWDWRITEKDLEMFIRKHPMDLNGRNVDMLMIVDILAGVITEE